MSDQFLLELNEDRQIIRDTIREFAQNRVKPHIMELDEAQIFPLEIMSELGALGFLGILVSEEYGGAGLGYIEYVIVIEELAKIDPSLALSVAAHNGLCTNHINIFGNDLQKQKFVKPLATGKVIGAWALTEPGHRKRIFWKPRNIMLKETKNIQIQLMSI